MTNPTPPLPLIRIESGSLILEFLGHTSVESYDADAGEPGACLQRALIRDAFDYTIHAFAEAYYPIILKISGIERLVDEKRTAKRKAASPNPDRISPILETFANYTNRVFSKVDEPTKKLLLREALAVSRKIRIVPPAAKTPALPASFLKQADSILSQDIASVNSRLTTYLALVPNFPITLDPDNKPQRESVARLLQQYQEAKFALED